MGGTTNVRSAGTSFRPVPRPSRPWGSRLLGVGMKLMAAGPSFHYGELEGRVLEGWVPSDEALRRALSPHCHAPRLSSGAHGGSWIQVTRKRDCCAESTRHTIPAPTMNRGNGGSRAEMSPSDEPHGVAGDRSIKRPTFELLLNASVLVGAAIDGDDHILIRIEVER
jgi:hypothetical protein